MARKPPLFCFSFLISVIKSAASDEIEPTSRLMVRVVHEVQSEGEDFELDPGLRNYFENEVGLTNEQIELVMDMARRVA